jgi:hypothetical protein
MRFLLAWTSLGVCTLALNGCFTVGDDDNGGQAGQKGETGGSNTGGSSDSGGSTTGGTGTGGASAGSGTGANGGTEAGGRASVFNRGGRAGSGGTKATGSGGSAGQSETGGGAGEGEGAVSGQGGSTSSGGTGGKGGTGGTGTGGTGATGGTGGNMPTATCIEVSDKVQSCSLFDGPFDCSVASTTPEQECINGCFAEADCNTLTGWYCGLSSNSVDDCVTLCRRFRCDDGSYISSDYVCDGANDCSGSEDEKDCTTCDGGYIVPTSYICDGVADCTDGTDEKNCPSYKCASGTSVAAVLRCDGTADCADGSDEKGCAARTCPRPKPGAACGDATKNLKTCGILPGGVMTSCSDRTPFRACEKECYASAACADVVGFFCGSTADGAAVNSCLGECGNLPDDFACKSGDLVAGSWVCDGAPDCNDGSDEVGCTFTCANGTQTIPESSTCNTAQDCTDGSDEMGCSATCNTK